MVIGGAGFIGSHLVDTLIENKNKVIVFDDFSRGSREYLSSSQKLIVEKGSILEKDKLASIIKKHKPELIYHLAAEHFIPSCENFPSSAIRINIEGTQNVLDACKNKVDKLIFTSTGAIYSPKITNALNENSEIITGDIYGITKKTCEDFIKYHCEKGRGKIIIARLFNAVGLRETNPHLLPEIMDQIKNGLRHIKLGNLYPKRDYIHVKDISEALFSLADVSIDRNCEAYNIGSGKEYTVEEIVKICAEVISEDILVESVPEKRRKYDRPNQLADISKIKSMSGWFPRRSLRQAIEEIWKEINN
jgi:UDP-glucose 4-epimerase